MTIAMTPRSARTNPGALRNFAETAPLHAFGFATHSILSLYARNADRLPLADLPQLVAIVLGAVAVVYVTLRLLGAGTAKAGLLTTVVVMPILYYANMRVMFGGSLQPVWFLLTWAVVMAALLWHFARSRSNMRPVVLGLNAMAAVVVAGSLWSIAVHASATAESRSSELLHELAPLPVAGAPAGPKRDIYYIVFDRYANAETLRRVYDFDNRAFLARLRGAGFYVADDAAANYQRTAHSIASSLSLGYLDRLGARLGEASGDWLPIYTMLQDHTAGRFLKQQGYRFLQFGSWWNPTRRSPLADENVNWHTMPQLSRAYLGQTAFGQIARLLDLPFLDDRANQCDRTARQLEALAAVAHDPRPTFVFAHLLVPHPPFVFDAAGRCMPRAEAQARSRVKNYTDQVIFANAQILELIDRIRATSTTDPVIVIQSDEGPWPAPYAGNEHEFGRDVSAVDWSQVPGDELREKMRILNALYLPGDEPAPFHPAMTPVNTFRIIFNRYFGTDLPLLPDRNYVFVDDAHLYKFKDVTDLVR